VGADAAREALARARQAAREQPLSAPTTRLTRHRAPGPAGPGPRDPVLLGQPVRDLVSDGGWPGPTAVAGVVVRWPLIVG
jgi:hypothetical protein